MHLVESFRAAFDGLVPLGASLVGRGVAGEDPVRLEGAQIGEGLFITADVEAVFVDVVGEGLRAWAEGHAVGGAEKDLVAGMGDAHAVNFHADQGGEAGVARHRVEGDRDVFPIDGFAIGNMAGDGDRLVPETRSVVVDGVFQEIRELTAGPDFGAEVAL